MEEAGDKRIVVGIVLYYTSKVQWLHGWACAPSDAVCAMNEQL